MKTIRPYPWLHPLFLSWLILLGSVCQQAVQAATPVSGNLSGTWSLAQSPILVTDDVAVPAGQTLTIEPGVVVQFRDPSDDLYIDGALIARGTAQAPIRFTSDDATQQPEQWGAILIGDSSDDAVTVLEHCVVEFGGAFRIENLRLESASPRILNCVVRKGRFRGVTLVNSKAQIENCRFEANMGYAVVMDPVSFPVLRANTATGNGYDAIGILGGEFTASGTWVRDNLPYTVIDDLIVLQGRTLTVEPGTTVQFQDVSDELYVDGALVARGAADSPIRFTSDDPAKAPEQWGAIVIRDSSDDAVTVFEQCIIECGGSFRSESILLDKASPTLLNCTVQQGRLRGITLLSSNARIENCQFSGNGSYAIGMDVDSFPTLRRNSASGNGFNAIAIFGGIVSRSGTWVRDDLYYTIVDDVAVAETVTLTLEPGLTLQFQDAFETARSSWGVSVGSR